MIDIIIFPLAILWIGCGIYISTFPTRASRGTPLVDVAPMTLRLIGGGIVLTGIFFFRFVLRNMF